MNKKLRRNVLQKSPKNFRKIILFICKGSIRWIKKSEGLKKSRLRKIWNLLLSDIPEVLVPCRIFMVMKSFQVSVSKILLFYYTTDSLMRKLRQNLKDIQCETGKLGSVFRSGTRCIKFSKLIYLFQILNSCFQSNNVFCPNNEIWRFICTYVSEFVSLPA